MTSFQQTVDSPRMHLVTGVVLSALWGLFAVAHLTTFGSTGKFSLLVFGVAETVVALCLLLRTQPKTCTMNPYEWAVAALGTFFPLLLRPTADTPVPIAEWGLILASTLQIAGVLSLNRSIALVPALRELKTGGMYRFVRHPIYSSYLLSYVCYLTANSSVRNLVLVLLSLGLLLARVHFEERHLAQTPEYRAYQSRVKWRLIPFVF